MGRTHDARSEPEAALAVIRVLYTREREADVLAEVDTLIDEVQVRGEGMVHDRAAKRWRVHGIDETALQGPCAGRQGGGFVDLDDRSNIVRIQ